MKNKNKFYLFAAAFLFLSVFFVGVDGVRNIAKADCYDECSNKYPCSSEFVDDANFDQCQSSLNSCYDQCGNQAVEVTNTGNFDSCSSSYPGSLEDRNGQCYCPSGSDWNSAGDACVAITYTSEDVQDCIDENTSAICCEAFGGEWMQSGVCYTNTDRNTTTATLGQNGSGCNNSDDCGSGLTCNGGICEQSTWGKLTGQGGETATPAAPATAADKKALNEAKSKATAATSVQNAATQRVNAEMKQQDMICKTESKEACDVATQSLNEAKAAYDKATEEAKSAIENANALSVPAGASPTTGAGFRMCANGILGTICPEGDSGVPYVAGISTSGLGGYGGGGLGGNYGTGGTANLPKCGANFEDIGGVCFPMNTGLSNAPIAVIISNIFSWLMGLFTTLAVLAFVISGVQYLMAAGDADLAETAKDNAKNAMIGIIVGLSGFIIIKAIAAALSGQSIIF